MTSSRLSLLLLLALGAAGCGDSTGSSGPEYPPTGELVSGDLQRDTVGDVLPQPIVLRVVDQDGDPIAGETVSFAVTAGGGSLFAATATTNAQGQASNTWTLGTVAGDTQRVEARMIDPESGQPVVLATFRAVGLPDAPATITAQPPAARTGTAGQPLADSLAALVRDAHGNPVPGAPVVWMVAAGGGTVAPANTQTGADGIARAQWTLGLQLGTPQVAEATLSPAVRAQFTATAELPAGVTIAIVAGGDQSATVGTALPLPVVAELRTSLGQPIPGAGVIWMTAAGSGTATPPASTTGVDGRASTTWTLGTTAGAQQLTAAPAGAAGLAVAGATALPGAAASVTAAGGNGQTAPPTAALPQPLAARVADAHGNALAGATVSWAVTAGGGSVVPVTSQTDASGLARTTWTLGSAPGAGTATASVAGATSATFTSTAEVGALDSILVTPATVSLASVGATAQLTARAVDAYGNTVPGVAITWTTTNPAVATVSQSGLVTAVGDGTAQARASGGGKSGAASITVARVPASVTVATRTTTVIETDTVHYTATVLDAEGQVIPGAAVTWSSGDESVATVSATGVVTGAGSGQTNITATAANGRAGRRGVTGQAAHRADTLAVGAHHTCSVDGAAAECWGSNVARQIGFTGADRSLLPRAVAGFSFASVTTGDNWSAEEWYQSHGCGVTSSGTAWCWGSHDSGQLGYDDGRILEDPFYSLPSCGNPELYYAIICAATPTQVEGGHTWRQLDAGANHTCGVTTTGTAYCWGRSDHGQLGTTAAVGECLYYDVTVDKRIACALTPRPVAGGHTFTQVGAGDDFSCGLTAGGQAWCWGRNEVGQLGDGTTTTRTTPVAVQGGIAFARLSAGRRHACAVTAGGAMYCWGSDDRGQLGNGGGGGSSTSPVAVAAPGGAAWARVSAGRLHSCGVTTAGAALCWGENENGQLGDGTFTDRASPVAVASQFTFRDVGAGGNFTCGRTTGDGVVLCWGYHAYGQLGNGLSGAATSRPRPGAVRAP